MSLSFISFSIIDTCFDGLQNSPIQTRLEYCSYILNNLLEMAARYYVLPANNFSGTVAGVYVYYNLETKNHVINLGNLELKRFLEDAAVSAALSRGYLL